MYINVRSFTTIVLFVCFLVGLGVGFAVGIVGGGGGGW